MGYNGNQLLQGQPRAIVEVPMGILVAGHAVFLAMASFRSSWERAKERYLMGGTAFPKSA